MCLNLKILLKYNEKGFTLYFLTCRPPGASVNNAVVKPPIKALLDHSATSIVLLQADVVKQHMETLKINIISAVVIFSYWFDEVLVTHYIHKALTHMERTMMIHRL